MRCFYVFLHGRLRWTVDPCEREPEFSQPAGFYCHRYVLPSNKATAIRKAINSASSNLDSQTGWLRDQMAELELYAEEVSEASYLKAFLPTNSGHTFYLVE